jgi:hypothetical protein
MSSTSCMTSSRPLGSPSVGAGGKLKKTSSKPRSCLKATERWQKSASPYQPWPPLGGAHAPALPRGQSPRRPARGPRPTPGGWRDRWLRLAARAPAPPRRRLSGVGDHDGRHPAPAGTPGWAQPPRWPWRWVPTSRPQATPRARRRGARSGATAPPATVTRGGAGGRAAGAGRRVRVRILCGLS